MNQEIEDEKHTFRMLLAEDASHEAVLAFLLPLRSKVATADDVGWVFWNICDQYALLRDARHQHTYQSEFHTWSKANLYPDRLHWVVSDATQAITLIDGGFLDFWWHCYQYANEHAPRTASNRTVRFESHRANAGAYIHCRAFPRAEIALHALEQTLLEDPEWINERFAAATFKTLLIGFHGDQGHIGVVQDACESLAQQLDEWLEQTPDSANQTHDMPLLGSWKQLNADRPPDAVFTATHNAACAAVRAKQFPLAERLFDIVLDNGYPLTVYAEAQHIVACWNNRGDQDEIRDLLSATQNVKRQELLHHAPELAAVVGNIHGEYDVWETNMRL